MKIKTWKELMNENYFNKLQELKPDYWIHLEDDFLFYDKMNYIVHFKNLKLYLQLGLYLAKIHRIVSFDQRPFMKK